MWQHLSANPAATANPDASAEASSPWKSVTQAGVMSEAVMFCVGLLGRLEGRSIQLELSANNSGVKKKSPTTTRVTLVPVWGRPGGGGGGGVLP